MNKLNNSLIIICSLFFIGFGSFTLNKSLYFDKLEKELNNKSFIDIKDLYELPQGSKVLIKGNVLPIGKSDSVIEVHKESIKKRKGKWKKIKEKSFFKTSPFNIIDKTGQIFIDLEGIDKNLICLNKKNITLNTDYSNKVEFCKVLKKDKILALGIIKKIDNKIIISNPNFNKTILSSIFDKEPFIVSKLTKESIIKKAIDDSKKIRLSSFALIFVGIFFLFSSIFKVFQKKKVT